eukprot:gene11178-3999_t
MTITETAKLFEENQPDTKTNEESKKFIYQRKINDLRNEYSKHFVTALKSDELRNQLPLEKQKITFKYDLQDLKTNSILSTIFTQRNIEGPLVEVDEIEIQKLMDSQQTTQESDDFDFDSIEEEAIKQSLKKSQKNQILIQEDIIEETSIPPPTNTTNGFMSSLQYQKQLNAKDNKTSNSYSNSYGSSNGKFDPAKSVVSHMTGSNATKLQTKKRKFKVPFKKDENKRQEEEEPEIKKKKIGENAQAKDLSDLFPDGVVPDEFKNLDFKLVEMINNEIMCKNVDIKFDDIAGVSSALSTVIESAMWPLLNSKLFFGIRSPAKGILLFGPPGTGKTLIGKAIATETKSTFFNISASSLMSKWIGEGEKLVKTLFAVARYYQPTVIFIDEIDSILSKRTDSDSDNGTRRVKTEFLVQLDGASTTGNDQILVVGATNRPQEIDDAVRRRLVKKLYIPLPDGKARVQIVRNLLKDQKNDLNDSDYDKIENETGGFSGADMKSLCQEAALNPIRELTDIRNVNLEDLRPITCSDFMLGLESTRPSVSQDDLKQYEEWNQKFGSTK